ncbi:hypothetical protein FACS1894180_5830 [Bacteroidia bacterium]|nr:hypothetical protein FACS1894180_5830 [Bacteroidia bacterium]
MKINLYFCKKFVKIKIENKAKNINYIGVYNCCVGYCSGNVFCVEITKTGFRYASADRDDGH